MKSLKTKSSSENGHGAGFIGMLYEKCIFPIIRFGSTYKINYKEFDKQGLAQRQEDRLIYQNRRRINSRSESNEKLLARHSIIANNGNYYFVPKKNIKLHFGISRGGPFAYYSKKTSNNRESKSN